ncbi:hypothetical protein ARMGADRAFT_1033150 [Armillaria gallica]|uniref:Aminoglycoside phosphotransferase domain-containing protein n=1 Tax=Armillaria gallica TaxID=47427 RepID=A0A2H3D2X6_ARMGA|nr:hypothetical protein ARMGADRAFT_1033150 [Armillaria gallica]
MDDTPTYKVIVYPKSQNDGIEQDLTDIPQDLWVPKSAEDLKSYFRVISPSPGIIIEFRGELSEEVIAQRFAYEKLGAIVPRVLYHPPLLKEDATIPLVKKGCWYIAMEHCPGVALRDVVDTMSPAELDHIAEQLKAFLPRMETITSPMNTMGSVWTESVLSQLPKEAAIRFAHADLVPKNIIVEGSTITGIVDWKLSGFFPDFWEYGRMHDPVQMTRGWDYVLQKVFPSPRREAEINSVRQLIRILFTVF